MGKLTEMVAEPVSLQDRLRISARRMRLAGIGLVSKVDAERARLYHQIMDMGDSYGPDNSLVGQLTRMGTGTVSLVVGESQRLFEELVEAGEQALAGNQPKLPKASGLTTPRPVAKQAAPKQAASKPAVPKPAASKPAAPKLVAAVKSATDTKPDNKPRTGEPAKTASAKPSLKQVAQQKSASLAKPVPIDELRQTFELAKSRLNTLTSPPDQATMLTLYALFKQATDGDVSGHRPGPTKLVERAKFDARKKIKGLPLDEAMQRYIATVDRLFTVPA